MTDVTDVSRWQDLSLCQFFPSSMWFEEYEQDERTAKLADEICESCPVRQLCLQSGIENGEYGCWGGAFLNNGKLDPQRNEHKTPEQLRALKAEIGQLI